MNPLDAYRYLIFRVYRWHSSAFGGRNDPRNTALFLISLFLYLNLGTGLVIYQIAVGYLVSFNTEIGLLAIAIVVAFVYFTFFASGRFEQILSQFASEDAESNKRGTVWCVLYISVTHIAFFGSAAFLPR